MGCGKTPGSKLADKEKKLRKDPKTYIRDKKDGDMFKFMCFDDEKEGAGVSGGE